MPPILSVQNLKVSIRDHETGRSGWVLRGIDFEIESGERVALVGESGCGKTVMALTLMNLLPSPPMDWVDGSVLFKGRELKELGPLEWREIRGAQLSMIFQEPLNSLNPVFTVGDQVTEILLVHQEINKEKARERVLTLFREVGLTDPPRVYGQFPHELSGGMCQRIMIAMAVACGPSLLIADEPTTALDVTVQAQILDMLFAMTQEKALGLLLITHNLPLLRDYAHRILILYAGQVVEAGAAADIFTRPRHPYTEGLLGALPDPSQKGKALANISGQVPSIYERTEGCGFAPRCPKAQSRCGREEPSWSEEKKGHGFRCFYPSET
ncbi:MAG: ABC transporter ATP-binding protein [bacterium]